MKKLPIVFCTLFALIVIGCQDAPSSSLETDPVALPAIDFIVHGNTPDSLQGKLATKEGRLAASKAGIHIFRKFHLIMGEADGWRDAHERVQRVLTGPSEYPQYRLDQTAAIFMLRMHLLEGEMTPEKLDALAYYTNLLARHKSPEGALVADALEQLKGHWSEAQVASAAQRVAASTEAYLASRLNCTDCAGEETFERLGEEAQSTQTGFLHESASALDQLHAMSRTEAN